MIRQRTRTPHLLAALLLPLAAVVAVPVATAQAAPETAPSGKSSDVREIGRTDYLLDGKKVDTPKQFSAKAAAKAKAARAAAATPPVGTTRQWLGLDDFNGTLYRKNYVLRGVGQHIEVWVAQDTAFPAGDCRTQVPDSTTVTDAQVASFVNEFDTNMYPKESQAFSVAPDRDGSNALVGPDANGNGGDYTGDGAKTVTLVDNVRDDNYYSFPANPTYIAGFFSAQLNELFDRNVMTIDAFDWAHRTGADPVDAQTADLCTSRPARPRLYEGTFAHEYQHLLQYYTDPFETTAVNEGLSDFAQTLTGYVDATKTVYDKGGDSHLYCFQGFGPVQTQYNPNPRDCGGPENSLNLWDESSNPNAVLADYGNAYSLMLFLYDRYGVDFMSALHRDGEYQGLASIEHELKSRNADLYTVLHDHQSMVLLDKILGDAKNSVIAGVSKSRVTSKSLRSTVNLANPSAYATPGAAPNGADYVQLRNATGATLKAKDLKTLSFKGVTSLPAQPLRWTVVNNDPDRPGNPVLWSGNENSLDASAVASVAVPTADPTLRFLAKYGAEAGYDYGYVQVSTDGGATYTSIEGDKTVEAPLGPGLNGTTDGFEAHSFDLSAYAGKTVLINFRYVSDGGVNEGGLLLDDITVGGTTISDGSSVAPFRSLTQVLPIKVTGWDVRLVGIRDGKVPVVLQVDVKGKSSFSYRTGDLAKLLPFDRVVAIVAYDEPTELVQQYAGYTLTVNGVVQPGG
ncbi:peptidase M6 immune inhibitor A [Spongisporangium articulatum]|uniref:Peptidase M6 immune inhibitor A n=1 Tax=Spongisporangium articulatum TaxID=3362603 RepID=A0ABW8AHT6_9ACTN